MEKTLAGIVSEVEQLVKPLGFKIETVRRGEKVSPLIGVNERNDDGELTIAIVRKGNLG